MTHAAGPEDPPVIRPVRPGEGPSLRDLRLRALIDAPEAFASSHAREVAYPPDVWESRAGSTEAATFVAEDRGGWWGLVTGLPDGDGAHLVSMWVDPSRRGRGVGAALVDAVVGWARASGAREVALWVVDGNDPASALYRRMGFEATGERQPVPSHPERSEQRMMLRLAP